MSSRLLSLLVWALVAASAVAWGLTLLVRSAAVPVNAVTAQLTSPAIGPAERVLGSPAATPPADAPPPLPVDDRFKLLGVVAAQPGRGTGWALIAVDGQVARAVALGHEVEPGLRLLSVAHRRVELGSGGGAPKLALELPLLPEPARGLPAEAGAAMTSTAPQVAAPVAPGAALSAPVRSVTPGRGTVPPPYQARGAMLPAPTAAVSPQQVRPLGQQQVQSLAQQQAAQQSLQQARQAATQQTLAAQQAEQLAQQQAAQQVVPQDLQAQMPGVIHAGEDAPQSGEVAPAARSRTGVQLNR